MKRYYLKAIGSCCYNKQGVTSPPSIEYFPIERIAKVFFGKNHSWCRQFGWSNQPQVLCFTSDEHTAGLFEKVMNAFYRGFIVLERDWA